MDVNKYTEYSCHIDSKKDFSSLVKIDKSKRYAYVMLLMISSNYLPGALVQQYNTTHEVIVVNDNSFDETKYLLEEYRKTYRHLQVVELKQELHTQYDLL